jgi:phosphoglycolate phosphatase
MIAYHLVIFDFDGTVVDTKDCIAGTVNSTLVKYGIRPQEPAAIHDLIGLTLDELFETLTRSERERPQLAMLVDTYRDEYNRVGAPNATLFPGVLETLQGLLERKIPMAIATGKGIEGVLLSLDALHIRDYFAHIVTEASVSRKKPLPEMVLRILDATGISAERAIVVGDTVHDIRMGKAAGTATCAVTYGCHNARQLASEAPTFLVQNGFELRRMLMEPPTGR